MKKEINFSVVSGTLILVWLVFSPILGLVVYSYLDNYFNIPLVYILVAYLLLGFVFYRLGKYLNKKLGLQGYSEKEINTEELKIKNKFWSLDIDSVEHANKVINETSWTFLIIGIILLILSFLIIQMQYSWFDGLISIFFGSMLAIKRNTWTSVVVMIIGITDVIATVSNKINGNGMGSNIYWSLVILWLSIHSFIAIKYLKNNNEVSSTKQKYRKVFVISAWISAVLFIILIVLTTIGLIIMS
ncbi:MAG TPA: hypothetical protein VK153_02805 [Candidatus Paceibacterota bacterium]|nr:hypothetical protein [Candidatus Paceibacterota bacterium]